MATVRGGGWEGGNRGNDSLLSHGGKQKKARLNSSLNAGGVHGK